MKRESLLMFLVSQLREGEDCFELEGDPAELGIDSYTFTEPVNCKLSATRISDRVYLEIAVSSRIRTICARCGEPTVSEINAESKMTFLPHESDDRDDDDQDGLDYNYYTDEIDLAPVIRETFLLAVPIAPLCAEDCKGLCPVCGVNLNKISCDCNKNKKPSPFEDLRRMIDG